MYKTVLLTEIIMSNYSGFYKTLVAILCGIHELN